MFYRTGGGWKLTETLAPNMLKSGDVFGQFVDIDGSTVAVGAREWSSDPDHNHTGQVYIFRRNKGGADNWGFVTRFNAKGMTASGHATADPFGYSLDFEGNRLAVGAYMAPKNPQIRPPGQGGSGRAYIFERNQGGDSN